MEQQNGQLLRIADSVIQIDTSLSLPENYRPFLVGTSGGDPVICTVTVGQIAEVPRTLIEASTLSDGEEIQIYREADGSHYMLLTVKDTGKSVAMHASPTWNRVALDCACRDIDCPSFVVDKMLMMAFIYSSTRYQTVLLHASCVRIGTEGVAFIGPSGAGKSTHSRLWMTYIPGTELLNDDQPAVRVVPGGEIQIYGTPWSGKTPCYKSGQAVLKGLFRMVQASENRIIPLEPVLLFRELLASCSMMKSEPDSFKQITSTLAKIATAVSGFILENRPEREAAMMAYETNCWIKLNIKYH